MKDKPRNPRMLAFDASKARTEDYFSLIDHFAGLALQRLIGSVNNMGRHEWVSREAYHYADAMLKVREETLNQEQ